MSPSAWFWIAIGASYLAWAICWSLKTWYTNKVHGYFELGMKMGRAQLSLTDDVIAALLSAPDEP